MNPLVLFIFLVGCVVGYLFARVQLRGRFLLALDGREEAPLPGPWCPPEAAPLSQQWNLPARTVDPVQSYTEAVPAIQPSRRVLRRFPDAQPMYFSAKQIIGRQDEHGFPRAPQYPDGLTGWYRDHGFVVANEDGQ